MNVDSTAKNGINLQSKFVDQRVERRVKFLLLFDIWIVIVYSDVSMQIIVFKASGVVPYHYPPYISP